MPGPLSRSLSMSSCSSAVASDAAPSAKSGSKRTRKRFSQDQLIVLEQVFHKTSHPTREERDTVANQTGMDLKSVTIWFQNKRQTERKVALHNSTNHTNSSVSLSSLATHTTHYSSSRSHTTERQRRSSYPPHAFGSSMIPSQPLIRSKTTSSFLSLDRVASRSELTLGSPRTPTKLTRHASQNAPWECMPSSPLQPELSLASPFSRDILDFASNRSNKSSKRTLEWACAAARVAEKTLVIREPQLTFFDDLDSFTTISGDRTDFEDTELESASDNHDEAITPDTSQDMIKLDHLSHGDQVTKGALKGSQPDEAAFKDMCLEEDIMNAAWALCGLSRG